MGWTNVQMQPLSPHTADRLQAFTPPSPLPRWVLPLGAGNEYGQVCSSIPERDVVHPTKCLSGLHVTQVAAGGMHSLALTENGQIWMWGEPWWV